MIGEFIELSNGIEVGNNLRVNNLPSFKQKKSATPYRATVVSRNTEICQLEGKIEKSNYETTVSFSNEKYIIKSYGQSNTVETVKTAINTIGNIINGSFDSAMSDLLLPQIYDSSGNQVGKLEMLTIGEGVDAYFCYKYTINEVVLLAYEVAQDGNLLYCIFNQENQMVAEVVKERHISNGHARYTLYCCNDNWFKYVVLVISCWAIQNNSKDGTASSHKSQTFVTTNTNLLSKYNPTFIEQVKQKEGSNNLPENMPLVKEKVNEAKKGEDVKTVKYTNIIFIVVAIIFLIICVFMFLK